VPSMPLSLKLCRNNPPFYNSCQQWWCATMAIVVIVDGQMKAKTNDDGVGAKIVQTWACCNNNYN
jgi:hypothetical protein